MTENQENAVRAASKFLRTIYNDDVGFCAGVLCDEAELLSGKVDAQCVERQKGRLVTVRLFIDNLINEIKTIQP
jgi:hypothetical protein